jgi:multisubunit Na+/H+ antiporter MnhE subunit
MGPPGSVGWAGAGLAWVGWWLALLGFWLALSNAATAADLGAGALVAALGATASVMVRAQRRYVARPRAVWLRRFGRPLVAFPGDLVRLGRALARPTAGRMVEVPFAPGEEDGEAATRHLLAVVAGSLAPDTIVVDFDEVRAVLIAHALVGDGDPDPLGLG